MTGTMDARIFEGVIRDSSVAVTVVDGDRPELPIVYANPAYLQQCTRNGENVIGQPTFGDEKADDNRAAVAEVSVAVRECRACRFIIRAVRQDGAEGWKEIDLYPLTGNGSGKLFAAIHRDVSKRVETENRLRTTNKALLRLAIHDGLTGIYNRHFFDQMLAREWHIQTRARGELAILMIDIDNFKQLNDRLGHHAGDECLRSVAATLDACLRRGSDFVARYGGDEFIALLTGTKLDQATQVAEIICEKVRDLALSSGGEAPCPVTITIGVAAAAPVPPLAAKALVERADDALYRAKTEGKNRVGVTAVLESEQQMQPARAGNRN